MEQFGKNMLMKRVDGVMAPVSHEKTIITSKETMERRLAQIESGHTDTATVEDMAVSQSVEVAALEEAEGHLEVAKQIKEQLKADQAQLQAEVAAVIAQNSYDRTLVGRATGVLSNLMPGDLQKLLSGIAKR